MAHIKNIGSLLSGYSSSHNSNQNNKTNNEDIVKKGYLAKRKSMKSRFFVLRRETSEDEPARLEYYDSEKKFKDGFQPKKKYILKDCFNISQKTDKNNFVIALYINKDCVGLVTENETEMKEWLQSLQYHKNSSIGHVETRRIDYDHVWQVEVLPRSLASTQNLTGKHWLCLTNRLLSLVRLDNSDVKKEFQLSTIKKCGFLDQFFFFQLGRYSGIGCGELYMQTEDSFIAQNIHNSVGSAMNNFRRTSSLTDSNNIRKRTTSDPQDDVVTIKARERADSVPNNPRNHFTRMKLCPSLEKIHQQQELSSDARLRTFAEDDQLTPDKEFIDFDEEFPHYIPMEPSKLDFAHPCISSSSDDGYVPMDSGREHQPPTCLGVSPRLIPASPSSITAIQASMTSPVSPCIMGFPIKGTHCTETQLSSPQTSTYSSRVSELDDAYVPMQSPGSKTPVSAPMGSLSNHYIHMGPVPYMYGDGDRGRTTSTPTPIALSPSDEDSCELFGTSETSSCTSGNSCDQRIHDFIGDERGSTPRGGALLGNLAPGFFGVDDPDGFGGPRPNRTSSVGSKPEQFRKKTRMDVTIVPAGEPSRVRAFSLGSRMSHKFGMGRLGNPGTLQGPDHHTGAHGDIFPTIKQCVKQAKNKSSSAPILDGSLVSHSWSGTPGSYFRGFIQNRSSPRENNLMEMDFSKNRSCDVIPSDDKDKERDKKISRERLWHTFTGHRHRSNSKSSCGSNSKLGSDSWGLKEKKDSEGSVKGVEIPFLGNDSRDYLELDFRHSPKSSSSDSTKGYLPMHPSSFLSSSYNTGHPEITVDKRGPRTTSLNENYLEMSSSLSSCASHDGYVDMTQGGSSCGSGLNLGSSSSSSTSINSGQLGGRSRRTSSNIYVPIASSQELSSPVEDVEGEVVEGKKKGKKGNRRKSLKDSALRRKKSEGDSMGNESPEVPQKSKGNGPFASLTNFITRSSSSAKGSTSQKTNLPSKTKDSGGPFASLKRSKSKEKELVRLSEDEKYNGGVLKNSTDPYTSTSCPSPSLSSASTLKGTEVKSSSSSEKNTKSDEKMFFSPRENKIRKENNKVEWDEKNIEAPSIHYIQNTSTSHLPKEPENRNYVNMQVNSSSPKVLLPGIGVSSPNTKDTVICNDTVFPAKEYSVTRSMSASFSSSLSSGVTKQSDITNPYLSCHSQAPSLELKKLCLSGEKAGNTIERSRSHSGPGASENSRRSTKISDLGRTSSACSSPVSYSPPTSPTLGSQSSMSSLSEGALSSASSTCTVVNVGEKNPLKTTPPPTAEPKDPPALSSKLPTEDDTLNYAALDLGSSTNPATLSAKPPSPRLMPKSSTASSNEETPDPTYVEIDFKKSEGLKNTSVSRDIDRPQ